MTTWYRLGIIGGKGLSFQRANVAPTARDHTDFGTDGGAHNFIRYIENWGGQTLNYRGSLISFYTSRQARRHLQVLRHRLLAADPRLQLRRRSS